MHIYAYMREGPQNTGNIFWKVRSFLPFSKPLVVQASPVGECSRNPSVSVHQLAFFDISEFFEESFSAVAHFMMGDL